MDDTNNNPQPISSPDLSSYSSLAHTSLSSRIMAFITAWGTWRGYVSAILIAVIIAYPVYFLVRQGAYYYSSYILSRGAAAVKPIDLLPVTADNLLIVSRTESTAVAIVRLKNTNKGHGVAALRYNLKNDVASVGEVSGVTYILPDDEKLLVVPLQSGATEGWHFNLVNPTEFSRPILANKISLTSGSLRGQSTERGYEVSGQLINNSPYHVTKGEVNVVLHHASGKIRAAIATQATAVKANSSQLFSVTWPLPLPSDTVIEVRSSVNTFSRTNFTVSDIASVGDRF